MEFSFSPTGIAVANICLILIVLRNIVEVKRYTTKDKGISISNIFTLITLILCLPIFTILLIIFALYQKLISLILKIKFGSQFGGLLSGPDAFHMSDDPSHSIIHSLMLVKCITKRNPEEFFDCIKTLVWKLHQHSKFKMVFLQNFGYSFMVNGDLRIDDCIKKMKTINCQKTIEKKELMILLNECSNAPLLKSQSFSWEIIVGTQSVNWNEDEYEYYPLLFRINHTVADGVALLKLMLEFADKEVGGIELCDIYTRHTSNKKYYNHNNNIIIYEKRFQNLLPSIYILCKNVFNQCQKLFKLCLINFSVLLLSPASLFITFMCKANDCNILHGPPLSGQKILAMNIDKSPEYFLKTKRIKNKVPETTFSNVLITAFSASLAAYFQKHTAYPPQYITATIPVLSGSLNIQNMRPGNVTAKVSNGYSFLLMNLPAVIKENQTQNNITLLRRLTMINRESNSLKNSGEFLVHYFLMNFVCSIVPYPVVRFILNRTHCSTVISILPAPPNITYCDGSMCVSDVVSWPPHLHNVGTSFLINTHDDRLHMGLSVDKALIAHEDIAQHIVDGVYHYLDLLADEVDSVYPDSGHE